MKAAEQKIEAAKKVESEERKPKYIGEFLRSAETRRLDRLRAEEKMLQLEREKEGDEFVDKEKFVTEAYKKQMEAVRAAEEEERKRDGESSG
jgi:coiled-coil domain-containing protein 55